MCVTRRPRLWETGRESTVLPSPTGARLLPVDPRLLPRRQVPVPPRSTHPALTPTPATTLRGGVPWKRGLSVGPHS